jgi:hypothetical protein
MASVDTFITVASTSIDSIFGIPASPVVPVTILYSPEKSDTGNPAIAQQVLTAVDCTGLTKANGILTIDLKCSNWSDNDGDAYLEITSSGTYDINEWGHHIADLPLTSDWQTFEISLSDWSTSGGDLDVSAINYIRFYSFFSSGLETIYWRNAKIKSISIDQINGVTF